MATLEQIERALRAADAAGNTEDARRLAQAYAQMRDQQQSNAPQPRADFSRVTGGVDSTAPEAEEPRTPWIQGEGRGYGIGARSVLQGAGSLLGAVGGDAFNMMLPGDVPSYREIGGRIADRIGLPEPQDRRERIAGDVGEALTGTGLTLGGGAILNLGRKAVSAAAPTIRNRVADFLTMQPHMQVASTATGAGAAAQAREDGAGAGQQLAAGLLGGVAPGATSQSLAAATRGLVRGRDGAGMREVLDDFASLGATPSVGQATRSRNLQGLENLLAGGPTSAGHMSRFAERQADEIGSGLQNVAQNLTRRSSPSAERAGRAIERGVGQFSRNISARRAALYDQADSLIPPETGTPMTNTVRALSELTTPTPGAAATTGALINPKLRQLTQNLATDLEAGGGAIPYSALRNIRSEIGEQLGEVSLMPDMRARELRRLYAALSEDMQEVARAQGPDAARAAKRANDFTRASANRLEQVERVIDKNGGPERVFQAAMSGTRDGGTTLRAVMQSLPKEGQREVTAAVIRRMGMPTPGQAGLDDTFSAATFLTNWNRVSPEARRAMFNRHGFGFSQDMDRLARVADNIKTGSRAFSNPSGTANRAAAYTYGGSLALSMLDPSFTSTGSLIAGGVGANAAARLMTNPKFVRWLSRTTQVPAGSLVAQANALRRIGEDEGSAEMLSFAEQFEAALSQQPGQTH